jgi:predicted nucleic acid-binding protein
MIVVADTSPINYLILIGHIEILPEIYREITVPQAVLEELRDIEAPTKVRDWLSALPAWFHVDSSTFPADALLDRLDRGERDAILLAEAIRADRLVMDDLDGRREAENRNLAVIGTLGILAEAGRRKLLDLSQALAALQATNFHASPALIERLLRREASRQN